MSAARIVLITHPPDGAESFARGLVERRLAACVNLLAARSVYRWEGAVQADDEVLLVAKTDAARLDALQRHVAGAHPYDVPECVALRPAEVEPRYLAWLLAATAEEEGA
jgi:periplasmic divalent cation tolerance protein